MEANNSCQNFAGAQAHAWSQNSPPKGEDKNKHFDCKEILWV